MSGKSVYAAEAMLNLILNGIALANIADDAASSPLGNLYFALHTADPTDTGGQNSSEVTYTDYARVAIARNPGSPAWTISTNTGITKAVPNAAVNFPTGSGGSGTATHFSIGTAATGAGHILYSGTITDPIATGSGVTPTLSTNSYVIEG